MKVLAEETEKVGIESENTVLAPVEVTLGEKTENAGTRTPVVVEKTAVKKKMRIVKKIVKKRVIKKVPKRVLVAPNCNDSEKVASPNPNDNVPMEIDAFVPVEIEKPNVVVDDLREVENMKEFGVSDWEKGVGLVENNDSCRDESERSGLVTASVLGDQNRIELHDREHDINNMDVEELEDEEGAKEQAEKSSKMDVGASKGTKVDKSVKEKAEKRDYVGVKIEVGLSNDVEGEESMREQEEKREHIDLKLTDAAEGQEGVKEVVENSETDGLRAEQGLSERRVLSGEMVASGWHMKQRTKIFIHGLDKETKEEDIRKVFEEIGKVIEVKLITNRRTGKNRGFGFIRYASVGDARSALMKYQSVEICGRPCRTTTVEGNDTILLNNIDKKWKSEYVLALLQEIGIKKIDKVSVVADPENTELNRGFAFLELETKKDAQIAYRKLKNKNVFGKNSKIKVAWAKPLVDPVEEDMHNICGRPCRTTAVEGNDTILLNNIDKKWKSEHVLALLWEIGIKKIDKVSVVADPENTELNRGFAFLELETKKDAQMAYDKLKNKNVFGRDSKIKVAWAEPLVDPVEEEMHNIKSVYAEHIPSSWDEEEVKDHFKIFGEIESIALAKNLRSTKRNDFAFINYKTPEAALSCIEALACKQSTRKNGPKAHLKVSLAKSIPKGKPIKTVSESAVTELSKVKQQENQGRSVYKPHKPKNVRVSSTSRHEDARTDGGSSTTAELVQLLREQASWKLGGPGSTIGMSTGHHQPPSGGKQWFPELGSELLYHDPRAYHQTRLEIPNAAPSRSTANWVAMTSFPHYDQQRANYTSGSFNGVEANPRYFQTRDQATYHGNSSIYRRMH